MATTLYTARPNQLKVAAIGTPPISNRKDSVLEVQMFNVGAGEAILIVFPLSRAWLIDGGATNSDSKNKILGEKLADYLKSRNLKLEALIASHPHKDHVGAVSYLLARKPKLQSKLTYYYTEDPPMTVKPDWANALENDLRQLGSGAEMINMRNKHREVTVSDRVHAHLFAGSGEGAYTSIFMHLQFNDATLFFSGDVHCRYENELLARYGAGDFLSDVLKITHHGSSTGTGRRFVNAVKPALAVASTSIDGGHRLEEAVKARLPSLSKTIETLTAGDITIRTEGRLIPSGVLYEVKTSFSGLFAKDLSVPDITKQKPSPPQESAPECSETP